MNEAFKFNKIATPYRENLAKELKEMTSEEREEKLLTEQNKKGYVSEFGNQYKTEEIEQRADWIVEKYFSESDILFETDDDSSPEERAAWLDMVLDNKIREMNVDKKGVADKLKREVYRLAKTIIKEKDIETNPNLKHIKEESLDIILQGSSCGTNKFIELEVRDNDLNRNIFDDLLVGMDPGDANYFKKKGEKEENQSLMDLKELLSSKKFEDEDGQLKFILNNICRSKLNTMIIARPVTSRVFNQHKDILNEFERKHKSYKEDRFGGLSTGDYHQKDPSLVFGEGKKKELEDFSRAILEVIKSETNYQSALEKINRLPKPNDLEKTFSVRGGGYMSINKDGKITPDSTSQNFGPFDKRLTLYAFEKDLGKDPACLDEKFIFEAERAPFRQ